MAITFDKSLNVIEVTGTLVTIQELIDAIRDWEDSPEGITVKSVANAYGKQDLGASSYVGITLELINNWRVQFEAKTVWTNCYIRGGNLVAINDYGNDPIKPSSYVNIIIAQSTSPTLVISGSVWTEQDKNAILSNVEMIKQINSGKWYIVNNQMIFYEDDNETEIMRFNLVDQAGLPSMTDIYERLRV